MLFAGAGRKSADVKTLHSVSGMERFLELKDAKIIQPGILVRQRKDSWHVLRK